MKKLIQEHFDNIVDLLRTVKTRKKNVVMLNEDASETEGFKFTKTNSFKEAEDLIKYGYKDILEKIIAGIKRKENKFKAENKTFLSKVRPQNSVIGFVPNVPNALQNLPESMIMINKTIQKKKVLDINYIMCGNCNEDAQLWVDAGIVLLSAIKLIELTGISVKLNVCFFAGTTSDTNTFATLCVKNYKDKLDLQKLCFPLAHPSMFRRIGFKWIETIPGLEDKQFACGYGRSQDLQYYKNLMQKGNTFMLDAQWIRQHDYDVEQLINYLK